MTKVLARTDFAAMFALLPDDDRKVILGDLSGWVHTMMDMSATAIVERRRQVLRGDEQPPQPDPRQMATSPLFNAVVHDRRSGIAPRMLTTSRGQWLLAMTQGADLSSAAGKLRWASMLKAPDENLSDEDVPELVDRMKTTPPPSPLAFGRGVSGPTSTISNLPSGSGRCRMCRPPKRRAGPRCWAAMSSIWTETSCHHGPDVTPIWPGPTTN
ncbi:hypothetical protein [Fodinicola feengrottensis]|uniref:hypothetical protein n=1 Tax=Fodinicola feengrottensis TaxID=435914 RepID=UPI0013D7D982|nr:hypothetical protein [Fodinicola feengrottensis]